MSRIIREAQPSDMAEIMLVMDAAKKIMSSPEPTYAKINEGKWIDDTFTYCGIIYLLSGDERLAYQKVVNR